MNPQRLRRINDLTPPVPRPLSVSPQPPMRTKSFYRVIGVILRNHEGWLCSPLFDASD
ncbi:hypothetical protein BDQ17DRAFT_824356 [Cyathus striatus]|nr:hypothetical protein BDQ17DRAFT_824356 [Cyathus striatus]